MTEPLTAGERFVRSDTYLKARRDARSAEQLAAALAGAGPVAVLDPEETRAALKLRTFSNLYPFSVADTAYAGQFPDATLVPSLVETIPTDKDQVELGAETSEQLLATSTPVGTPLVEGALSTGASTPTLQIVHPFGVSLPVALGVLDDPGQMASFLNRRIEINLMRGLENDILNGNSQWPGAIASAASTAAKGGSAYSVESLVIAAGAVQEVGWYSRPAQVILSPTSKGATLTDRSSTSGDPVLGHEMLRDFVTPSPWPLMIPSMFVPTGSALVGDLFAAIALFTKGDLEIEVSRLYRDFLLRGMAELKISLRAHCWVREPTALTVVTALA